jgi:hypothetical protein
VQCKTVLGRGWSRAQRQTLDVYVPEALVRQYGVIHVVDDARQHQTVNRRYRELGCGSCRGSELAPTTYDEQTAGDSA